MILISGTWMMNKNFHFELNIQFNGELLSGSLLIRHANNVYFGP